ncbi:MAG TPA: glycerophosphodiester phosphodiesterase [Deltaproteobacteria bacterium]|jgi:glycerophosphoryl diester phosphodiesterase|nr:glycerophosphodiester phosphodiesterase [Deltaproteobacteria bacterium]
MWSASRLFFPLLVAGLALAACSAEGARSAANAPTPRFFPFFEPLVPPRSVQVMAHRGLASAAPENTARAVEMSIEDGYEWVEVDVRETKDGHFVLFHGKQLEDKTDGKGLPEDHTLDELLKLDAGARFSPRYEGAKLLTLREALRLAKGRINLYLDCREKDVDARLLVHEIMATKMENQVIFYGTKDMIARVRSLSNNSIPVMTKWHAGWFQYPRRFARLHGLAAVEIDADELTPELVKGFHAAGVKVEAKMISEELDNPKGWEAAIAAGADWVQTDHPLAVLTQAFHRREPAWPVAVAYHGGADRYAPENTIPAVELAAALGADYIELDVRTTKDGSTVLLDDSTFERTTSGKGEVAGALAEEVRKLDAGTWFGRPYAGAKVPTLDEALTAIGDRSQPYLDAKDISPEQLSLALRTHGLVRRSVVYQSPDYLKRLKEVEPSVRLVAPISQPGDLETLTELQLYGIQAPWRILSKELVEQSHARGTRVFFDSLDSPETVPVYRQAMDWGVDVIETDRPAQVLRAAELEVADAKPVAAGEQARTTQAVPHPGRGGSEP